MMGKKNPYNTEIPSIAEMQKLSTEEITGKLQEYLEKYKGCFVRSQQIKYGGVIKSMILPNVI